MNTPAAAPIADLLSTQGWACLRGWFPDALARALDGDWRAIDAEKPFRAAGTGRDGAKQAAPPDALVRTDRTLWLDGSTSAQRDYLARMEALRLSLNETLFLGLFDYECHYALYPPGGFYKKHVDSLHGARNRIVSCVTYLTPGWTEDDGGHLVLYASDDPDSEIARILPEAGTLAVFLSEDIPHEVLPPVRERASIAGWFRCNASSANRADPVG